ncbi:protein of unknown function [Peptoniphilus asaccharolyticus DSM 20463]|uniref:Nucleotide modification associated domain-containing protein n=1 Tax=Peptoniphilus asaccharolyticus DSM 20463 TaxID=573058 RepID=A0A1W1UZK6_PEPAS|nr:nucleotide modification associated domain-containing protein [Peptoniphilus asaccharolyticus]MBL7575391.1 DUF1599 domain-containing protein [Peptoniphilus asaccharolyticus]SMB86440.1 protein of unknown function [Peptoniphilus asaccharolyticus DSM 20463]
MKEIAEKLVKIYEEKNKQYGNSFTELYNELGPISAITQILHKSNRLKALVKTNNIDSIKDTLIDLANYSMMTLQEIEKREQLSKDNTKY